MERAGQFHEDGTANDGTPNDTVVYDGYGALIADVSMLQGTARFGYPSETAYTVGYGGQWGYYADPATRQNSGDSGFLLCTHRWYDPINARWLTRDPIGYDGEIGLYCFCAGNPIMLADPFGLRPPTQDELFENSLSAMFAAYGFWTGGGMGGAGGLIAGGGFGDGVTVPAFSYAGAAGGTVVGGILGKGIGRFINVASDEVAELIERASSDGGGSSTGGSSNGGESANITYGKNYMKKFRSHVQQMRMLTGVKVGDVGSSAGEHQIKALIRDIVENGETRTIRWTADYPDALWSRKGDAIVIRQANGEFVTFLDATKLKAPSLWK